MKILSIKNAYSTLTTGGVLITTNIMDNTEREFISNVVGWKMSYRTADELSSLLIEAGFKLENLKVYFEPQQIHCLIIAQI